MIGFRQVDARHAFLWEQSEQPAGRWHGKGEGPAHYFADTPYGAWAEFLRHEEITEVADLMTIRRRLWAVDIGEPRVTDVQLPLDVLTGGPDSYRRCRDESRRLRAAGARGLMAPSAALLPGGATGTRVESGEVPAPGQDGRVFVLFGPSPHFSGWIAAEGARPAESLLERVRHFAQRD